MVPACSMGSWLKLSRASKPASCAQLLAARARRPRIVSCRLEGADSAERSVAWRPAAPRARAIPGALVHLRLARSESFLESVSDGLRHDARERSEAAGTLGYLSSDTAGDSDVHHGRSRPLLYSGAADGAAAKLSRDLARARARRGLRRSVASMAIRSPRSDIRPTQTVMPAITARILLPDARVMPATSLQIFFGTERSR